MNHKQGLLAWALVVLSLVLLLTGAWALISNIVRPHATVTLGGTALRVTLANTASEQAQGLSGVSDLPNGQGMLFIFTKDGPQPMWMKDMKIPLDIIWLSSAKRVTHIEHDLSPDTYPTTYVSPSPARYVLEVPAGTAMSASIKIGTPASFELQ